MAKAVADSVADGVIPKSAGRESGHRLRRFHPPGGRGRQEDLRITTTKRPSWRSPARWRTARSTRSCEKDKAKHPFRSSRPVEALARFQAATRSLRGSGRDQLLLDDSPPMASRSPRSSSSSTPTTRRASSTASWRSMPGSIICCGTTRHAGERARPASMARSSPAGRPT